jgi:hypothetical protein
VSDRAASFLKKKAVKQARLKRREETRQIGLVSFALIQINKKGR